MSASRVLPAGVWTVAFPVAQPVIVIPVSAARRSI